MTSASTWWRLAGRWLFFASFCYQTGEIKKKKKGEVSEIQIIEAVTELSTEIYLFLIPLSAMGCTHASIKHYLDMFLRA